MYRSICRIDILGGATILCVQQSDPLTLDPKERLDFLKWNYEQCQMGYHSRDQMTHDIFYKMIGVLYWHMGFLSLPFLTTLLSGSSARFLSDSSIKLDISLKWWYFSYVLFIAAIGTLSLFILLLILSNIVNCKIALRKQCVFIENKINNRYLKKTINRKNDPNCKYYDSDFYGCYLYKGYEPNCKNANNDLNTKINQHWECICKREGFLKSTFDEEKNYILGAGLGILVLWILICLINLYFIWHY